MRWERFRKEVEDLNSPNFGRTLINIIVDDNIYLQYAW